MPKNAVLPKAVLKERITNHFVLKRKKNLKTRYTKSESIVESIMTAVITKVSLLRGSLFSSSNKKDGRAM
jgi:hypothetical protein